MLGPLTAARIAAVMNSRSTGIPTHTECVRAGAALWTLRHGREAVIRSRTPHFADLVHGFEGSKVSTQIARGEEILCSIESRKDRLEKEARQRNSERRQIAAQKGYCPRSGAGPMQPSSGPEDAVRVFRCDACRYAWTAKF